MNVFKFLSLLLLVGVFGFANIHSKVNDIQLIKQQLAELNKIVECNSYKIDSIDVRQSVKIDPMKPKVDKCPKKGDNLKKSPVKITKPTPPPVTGEPSYSGPAKKNKYPDDKLKDED
ncbi:hypothetical protein B566_EDAN015117 [Ephemera danica]|nr:hypothetical protein B566_EDAN015117 [Ephemera danica]